MFFFAGFRPVGTVVVPDDNKHQLVVHSRPRATVGHNCSMPPNSAVRTLDSCDLFDPAEGSILESSTLAFDLSLKPSRQGSMLPVFSKQHTCFCQCLPSSNNNEFLKIAQ